MCVLRLNATLLFYQLSPDSGVGQIKKGVNEREELEEDVPVVVLGNRV